MKTHPLSKTQLRALGATLSDDDEDQCMYEAEPGDGWGSPWGGFFVGPWGWTGGGSLPALAVSVTYAEALKGWLAATALKGV